MLFGGATVCRLSQPRRTTKCYRVHRQFGSSSTKSVCYARSAPKIEGKYIEFAETCQLTHCPSFKKQPKRDDQLSSKDTSTSTSWSMTWTINVNVATTRARVLSKYSTMSTQWTSSYSRSESASVAKSTTVVTASRSDIHDLTDDDDTLTAS